MQNQTAKIIWRSGDVPVSAQFDDPYFSLENGLDETRHVFLAGNDLPQRFCDGFHIGELGFGTGLNFLATLLSWRASGVQGVLNYTSFEAYPMTHDDMAQSLGGFDGIEAVAAELLAAWHPEGGTLSVAKDVCLTVVTGDARETLPKWNAKSDAWFLDGFSPAKNPELWEPTLMSEVGAHTKKGGTFATYTAAGFVRRGLVQAGFTVDRVQGFGRKRHMTRGCLPL